MPPQKRNQQLPSLLRSRSLEQILVTEACFPCARTLQAIYTRCEHTRCRLSSEASHDMSLISSLDQWPPTKRSPTFEAIAKPARHLPLLSSTSGPLINPRGSTRRPSLLPQSSSEPTLIAPTATRQYLQRPLCCLRSLAWLPLELHNIDPQEHPRKTSPKSQIVVYEMTQY